MTILGIDPGIASCGWAVIENQNSELRIQNCGVIKTPPSETLGKRLFIISSELEKIIQEFRPVTAAVEEIFFAKNVKTAITISHARGAILVTCARMGLEICGFTPLQVKQALTGYGQATKEQVGYMVKNILKLKELPKDDNTVDAIAVGICYINTNRGTFTPLDKILYLTGQVKANIANRHE